jgi:choice-of-anchor C domain-containing protein
MKKTLFGGVGLLILSLALVASPVKAAVDSGNGSFELGINPSPFTTIASGDSTSITGWTVNSGTVDYIGNYWQASQGVKSVDLDGSSQGSMSENLTTVVGDTYKVNFDLSGNPDGLPVIKDVKVSATNGTPQDYTFDTSAGGGNTHANMMWATGKSYTFIANTTSTTLTFASQNAGDYGPVIDNVLVTDILTGVVVPPPTCNANVTQTIVSDATTQYNGGNSTVLTPNVAWTTIPGASWVWGSNGSTEDTTVAKTDVFTKTFTATSTSSTATLNMSADNGYVIKVNGITIATQNVDPANEFNYSTVHTYNLTNLIAGTNTLEVDVTNFGRAGTTFANNPGGLVYSLVVSNNSCVIPTPTPPCKGKDGKGNQPSGNNYGFGWGLGNNNKNSGKNH